LNERDKNLIRMIDDFARRKGISYGGNKFKSAKSAKSTKSTKR